jgi:hypothetical protein
MAVLPYRKRLILLEEILTDGVRLFKMLHQSEEQLRRQLITGDYQAMIEAEEKRSLIQHQISALEEKRKGLVPEGTGMQKYIKTKVGMSSQPELLVKLANILEELKAVRVVHEVNRTLLEERLRFSKELQEALLAAKLTYDQRGQLKSEDEGCSLNIDRNC